LHSKSIANPLGIFKNTVYYCKDINYIAMAKGQDRKKEKKKPKKETPKV
jgi:hypothetical protein